MPRTDLRCLLLVATFAFTSVQTATAQVGSAVVPANELPLFAIEITVGQSWNQAKPAQEQQYFREHSANLKRLRDSGALVMGARYSDKGFILLAAKDEAHVRTMLDEDPSFKAEVFKYQVHPFNVFYGGTVNTRPRRAAQ